jgi:hypothetical protein
MLTDKYFFLIFKPPFVMLTVFSNQPCKEDPARIAVHMLPERLQVQIGRSA